MPLPIVPAPRTATVLIESADIPATMIIEMNEAKEAEEAENARDERTASLQGLKPLSSGAVYVGAPFDFAQGKEAPTP